jgi:hypothetical protein
VITSQSERHDAALLRLHAARTTRRTRRRAILRQPRRGGEDETGWPSRWTNLIMDNSPRACKLFIVDG